jgi:hypothetical protein
MSVADTVDIVGLAFFVLAAIAVAAVYLACKGCE